MEFTGIQVIVLAALVLLVIALYREWLNPALSFFLVVLFFLFTGIITAEDALKGLSNPQIIVIFILMLVTAGMRELLGAQFLHRLFSASLSSRGFLLRMMVSVSAVSAFMNNTPVVAFLIPFVKDWAERRGLSASRFLIPLSYATILGGMITIAGTSTNLMLGGLMTSHGLPLPHFTDFLYLGLLVTVAGWIYLYFWGYYLLPDRRSRLDEIRENRTEYIVETLVYHQSPLVGKTVREAGLRNLRELFLAEIIRGERVITPVSPDEKLQANDLLFFSGNTGAITELIRSRNGLSLPEQPAGGMFNFIEAVVPASSDLIGKRIRDSDFRNRFNASIIAIHRNGRRVSGKVGETILSGGDFLLLLSGGQHVRDDRNLVYLSVPHTFNHHRPFYKILLGVVVLALLITGVTGVLPLFTAALLALGLFLLGGVLSFEQIRKNLDFSLLVILVSSMAIAAALEKSGTARNLAGAVLMLSGASDARIALTVLFVATLFLTAIITNPAAMSINFPITLSLAVQLNTDPLPFCMALAFAASGDFMTPIGYQTNLMVYGPGGYSFRDFVRVGTPLTLLYTVVCLTFIIGYYHL